MEQQEFTATLDIKADKHPTATKICVIGFALCGIINLFQDNILFAIMCFFFSVWDFRGLKKVQQVTKRCLVYTQDEAIKIIIPDMQAKRKQIKTECLQFNRDQLKQFAYSITNGMLTVSFVGWDEMVSDTNYAEATDMAAVHSAKKAMYHSKEFFVNEPTADQIAAFLNLSVEKV